MKDKIISSLLTAYFLEVVILLILFVYNGQMNKILPICCTGFGCLALFHICLKIINIKNPYFLQNTINIFFVASSIVGCMIVLLFSMQSMITKFSYKIGSIQIKFPKGDAMIYDYTDTRNNNYYIEYYSNKCSIEIQKIHNDSNYSTFENMKQNALLDNKITDNVQIKDIYNSDFSEGTRIINDKQWSTYYTQVDNIKYTINYIIIDNEIYMISTANYSDNSKACIDKIDKTFATIKYNN